ncbi:SIMPL domain-containing protein [Tissierella creatinophila]|uniref:26 kDa periplasmic immunogenic protein n=1 Tax=Tissierella creatinophila DSM 6911 TaxID=1123403 RepID=A0A1U7M980_TISCR|nr:SIMPL domain-containing protein [Tissierella creatinophila]OLS03800.1 26 kDa periplasmic immunogenic protein precursor [Tissierella creatinophila DSM 6911]
MDKRIIRVKGVGKASMTPDQIKININLKSSNASYEKTIEMANKDLENIRRALKSEGFEKEDIKTVNFNVDTKYENETTSFNNYKRKFIGYEVIHSLKIEFENDSQKLGRVLNELTKSKSNPEFSIFYNLKDETEFKNQMLKNAIEDSRRKAIVIAEASGVRLGEILNINYSLDEEKFYSTPLSLQKGMSFISENISIVPEDLKSTDTVDIAWEIEK